MKPRTTAVALLLLGSGFSSLVYQTVWLRELRLVFGASTQATAAVLGIFMAGIGLGGYIFGARADRSANPLRMYALLELGISVAAALSPLLVVGASHVYFATGGSFALGSTGATEVRLLLTTVILGVPTFLMGGTLPAAGRSVTADEDVSRRAIATLYGVNTIGAVAGAALSTFFLIEALGNRRTLWLAVLVNLIVALVAWSMARGADTPADATAHSVAPTNHASAAAPAPFVYGAAAATGFTFLLLELVWYRMLAPILGGSTFTFGLILAVALLGIGIGGVVYARSMAHRVVTLPHFALTCTLEALAIVVPYALGDRVAVSSALLRSLSAFGFGGQLFGWSMISSVVVLPAAIVAGYQFPLMIALLGSGTGQAGRHIGRTYAWNTFGAIAGSLLGGFILLPRLSAPGCWILAAVVMLLLAVVAAAMNRNRRSLGVLSPLAGVVVLLLLFTAEGPTAAWRHGAIGAGRSNLEGATRNSMREWLHAQRRAITWSADGLESSVALDSRSGYAFVVNGKSDGHARRDAGTQVMAGLLGAFLHPNAQRSAVIGLGTGSSAGWLAAVPGMQRVDVAEIETKINHVARECTAVNQDVMRRSNVRLLAGDARELLRLSDQKYDIIFSEPSNPYRAGIASLFTREFYQTASLVLAERGIFLQWIQTYEIDIETLAGIYRTLGEVFPFIDTWQTSQGDLVVVATREPLQFDLLRMKQRLQMEPYRSALGKAWRTSSVEGMLAHHIGDQRLANALKGFPGEVNTDDRNLIEFGFARTVGQTGAQAFDSLRRMSEERGFDQLPIAADWQLVRQLRATSDVIGRSGASTESSAVPWTELRTAVQQRDGEGVTRLLAGNALTPQSHAELLLAARARAMLGDAAVVPLLNRLQQFDSVESQVVAAEFFLIRGNYRGAADSLVRAFERYRVDPWPSPDLMDAALDMASRVATAARDESISRRLGAATSQPFVLRMADETRKSSHLAITNTLDGGCSDATLNALAAFEPWPPWSAAFLRLRAGCYAARQHGLAERAVDDYATFMESEPTDAGAVFTER